MDRAPRAARRSARGNRNENPLNENNLAPCSSRSAPLASRLSNPITTHDMTHEERLARLSLTLPPAPRPVAVYRPVVVAQGLAYVSGHGPVRADGTLITGRVGADLNLAEGQAAARQVGLAILATLRAHFGSLDKLKRVIKLLGMVNCTPEFCEHPKVINGCSELFAEVFGEADGIGARSAVGMGSLPGNIAVEIEAIFELA